MQRTFVKAGSLGLGCLVVHCADRLPTAFHEAGHAIIAEHISQEGLVCDGGNRARFLPAGGQSSSLLRYVTITPRVTEKGQNYVGETKLAVRWRHMHNHLAWSADGDVETTQVPTLHSGPVCAAVSGAERQVAMVGLARMAWLFGGNAAEQRLVPGLFASSPATVSERVESLRTNPSLARGDLRKARQVAHETLPGEAESAAFEAAFAYADSILAARWSHVCALSGALLARGALDGGEMRCLLRQLVDASVPGHEVCAEARPRQLIRLLELTAGLHPFVYGCVWGLLASSL